MKVRVLSCQPQRQRDQQNDTRCRSGAKRLNTEFQDVSSSDRSPPRLQTPDAASVVLNRSKCAANPQGRTSSTHARLGQILIDPVNSPDM
jgi:hypothetical protein